MHNHRASTQASNRIPSFFARRVTSSILLALFIGFYAYTYDSFIAPLYSYLGLVSRSEDIYELVYAVTLIFLIMNVLAFKLTRFSDFFNWFLFCFVFTPTMVTSALVGTLPNGSYLLTSLLTMSFFFMITIPRMVRLKHIRVLPKTFQIGSRWLLLFFLLSSFIILAKFGKIMNFSSIDQIYEQRDLIKSLNIGRTWGYLLNWHMNVIGALLAVYGILSRKRTYIFLAIIAFLSVYMVNGAKMAIAALGLIFAVNFLFRFELFKRPYLLMTIPLGVVVFVAGLIQVTGVYLSGALLFFVSQIFMRSIAIQAAMLPAYANFFSGSPLTYYSHVTGVSALVSYPYDQPLGYVIGQHLTGRANFNANSNLWATDGIAALGYIGIPIIGLVLGIILVFFDAISKHADRRFLFLSTIPFLMAVANTSFFTAAITGGGLIIVVLSSHIKLPHTQNAVGIKTRYRT